VNRPPASKPGLDREAFDRLLAFLDPDRDAAGKRYVEIRRKLIFIFTCRGCPVPEELADITMDRVARKSAAIADSYVGDKNLYFYGVARKVFLESVRKKPKSDPPPKFEKTEEEELMLDCLEQCIKKLTPRNRKLILEYYKDEKGAKIDRRKDLAEGLGIATNALRIRAHRIRVNLQNCVTGCLEMNGVA
jgi:DNA-directed RNA polymerase specialized sigma24 family protein